MNIPNWIFYIGLAVIAVGVLVVVSQYLDAADGISKLLPGG